MKYGEYHSWIKTLNCLLVHRGECFGAVTGHHVKSIGAGGHDECNEIPLCMKHHTDIHTLGRKTFAERNHLDLRCECERLHRSYVIQ